MIRSPLTSHVKLSAAQALNVHGQTIFILAGNIILLFAMCQEIARLKGKMLV